MVVSGLPEPLASDAEEDAVLFAKICEEHLCCKPVVLKCVRLGKQLPDKPRRLRVYLRNEIAAAELLTAARHFRKSDDPMIAQQVYINEDLTPEAAKLAYEARQRRRRQRNQQNTTSGPNPSARQFHVCVNNEPADFPVGDTHSAENDSATT